MLVTKLDKVFLTDLAPSSPVLANLFCSSASALAAASAAAFSAAAFSAAAFSAAAFAAASAAAASAAELSLPPPEEHAANTAAQTTVKLNFTN